MGLTVYFDQLHVLLKWASQCTLMNCMLLYHKLLMCFLVIKLCFYMNTLLYFYRYYLPYERVVIQIILFYVVLALLRRSKI